jgi:hypothetical protein
VPDALKTYTLNGPVLYVKGDPVVDLAAAKLAR